MGRRDHADIDIDPVCFADPSDLSPIEDAQEPPQLSLVRNAVDEAE